MALMNGKYCIITGGAGSLGVASAKLLLSEGAKVMLVDQNQEDLERVAATLGSDRILLATANVSDAADTQAYIKQAIKAWGQLDVLFSNAGVSGTNAPITGWCQTNSNQSQKDTRSHALGRQ